MAHTTMTGEAQALDILFAPLDKSRFQNSIRRLQSQFDIYTSTSPEPLPAPGLIITAEIRSQSELYLPIAEVAAVFTTLYSAALTYPPIYSSTPFHNSLSWADTFMALPSAFQCSANPARLLESLLADKDLLTSFLFTSFLPERFYGIMGRYPQQQTFIRSWLANRRTVRLRFLDAACGSGEDTYGLALLLDEENFSPGAVQIDGWTLEPLEVWAATYRRRPHNRPREARLREATTRLLQNCFDQSIRFSCQNILCKAPQEKLAGYDLILCNGILGGPIIHGWEQLDLAVAQMTTLIAPGGILLAADNFHGGWKQQCPQRELRALFEKHGLKSVTAGEGIGGLKPYE